MTTPDSEMLPFSLAPSHLDSLAISHQEKMQYELLRQRPWHCVYRLSASGKSFIVKTYSSSGSAKEPRVYRLLRQLGVPTLPVLVLEDGLLIMDDLETSQEWRLALDEDMKQAETGQAVSAWYQQLHTSGSVFLQESGSRLDFIENWVDPLNEDVLIQSGQRFGIESEKNWQAALEKLERLKVLYRSYPQTFNYSDFAAENLALTREPITPVRAVVFDYDCFKTGTAYSDYRNVIYSLEGAARDAFQAAVGAFDPLEVALDTVLSTLEGIYEAAKREHLPFWAKELVPFIQSAEFASALDMVLASA